MPDPVSDAGPDDAAPDASGPCPGELLFTGGYVDWDSTNQAFDGVEFATLLEVANPQNTAMTAPNGRGALCLPAGVVSLVDFFQGEYLQLRYTVSPQATALGGFEMRGLTQARADALFADDLGLGRDPSKAQVLVAVQVYPEGIPAAGAQVTLGNESAGAFVNNGTGRYVAGNAVTSDYFVLFANVDIVGTGKTQVSVTPPQGMTCVGPDTIELVADAISATTFGCTQP